MFAQHFSAPRYGKFYLFVLAISQSNIEPFKSRDCKQLKATLSFWRTQDSVKMDSTLERRQCEDAENQPQTTLK